MNTLIANLIQTNKRVILPSFGAFIVYKDNEKVEISFNQYLNFDDHVLSEYVAEQKGVSREEAESQIASYVNDLNARLDAGETVKIDGLGTFKKDDTRIEFYGESMESEPAETEASAPAQDEEITVAFAAEEPKAAEEPVAEEPAPEESAAATSTESTTITNNYYYEEPKRRTWLWVLIIVILLLLVLFLCLFVINKDNAVYRFFFPVQTEVVAPAPVVVDTVAKPDTVVVEPKPEPETIATEKRYNIVVGTYDIKEIAEKRVEALKARGFEGAQLATFRGKYVAVIEAHSSLVEAEKRQEYIVDTYRIESYITNGGE